MGDTSTFVPTPWPAVNEQLVPRGGVELQRAPVMVSSGDHHYASRLLTTWRQYLDQRGWATAWITCHRDRTTWSSLLSEAEERIASQPILFVDWFPNVVYDPATDRDIVRFDDPDSDTNTEYPSDRETAVELFRRLDRIATRGGGLVILGACMYSTARKAVGADVQRHLCRGDGHVEAHAQLSMLAYPDANTGAPMGWLYKHLNCEWLGQNHVPLTDAGAA